MALAVDPTQGILLVGDNGGHRLVLFDQSGRSRGSIPCSPDSVGRTTCEPRAVALDSHDRIYLVDALSQEIEVLTSMGTRLARLDPAPAGAGAVRPQGIAVGASGRIYIVYAGESAGLLVIEPKGRVVLKVGFTPDGPFRGPVAVAVNSDESAIAVVDPEADLTVMLFSPDGQQLVSFGRHGEGEGTFSLASHVAWGPGNTLWVADQLRHSVSVFDSSGAFVGRIGGFGHDPGQFDYPVACEFLAPDRVAVLERVGARVQVLEVEVGRAREPQARLESAVSGWSGTSSFAEVD
jgi:hypothetical protein